MGLQEAPPGYMEHEGLATSHVVPGRLTNEHRRVGYQASAGRAGEAGFDGGQAPHTKNLILWDVDMRDVYVFPVGSEAGVWYISSCEGEKRKKIFVEHIKHSVKTEPGGVVYPSCSTGT